MSVGERILADAQAVTSRMACDPQDTYLDVETRVCAAHGFYWPEARQACYQFEDHEMAALRLARAFLGGANLALEAQRDALREARQQVSARLTTAEQWRHDQVMWVFAVMLGEIPEDTPEPPRPDTAIAESALGETE